MKRKKANPNGSAFCSLSLIRWVVGLSYHGSRIFGVCQAAAAMRQPYNRLSNGLKIQIYTHSNAIGSRAKTECCRGFAGAVFVVDLVGIFFFMLTFYKERDGGQN